MLHLSISLLEKLSEFMEFKVQNIKSVLGKKNRRIFGAKIIINVSAITLLSCHNNSRVFRRYNRALLGKHARPANHLKRELQSIFSHKFKNCKGCQVFGCCFTSV